MSASLVVTFSPSCLYTSTWAWHGSRMDSVVSIYLSLFYYCFRITSTTFSPHSFPPPPPLRLSPWSWRRRRRRRFGKTIGFRKEIQSNSSQYSSLSPSYKNFHSILWSLFSTPLTKWPNDLIFPAHFYHSISFSAFPAVVVVVATEATTTTIAPAPETSLLCSFDQTFWIRVCICKGWESECAYRKSNPSSSKGFQYSSSNGSSRLTNHTMIRAGIMWWK